MISILLADDHDIVRQGIRRLLEREAHLQICGEATSGRDAVRKAADLRPDVVILDLTMPELNGLDATRQIRRATPDVEVLIFTMHATEQLVREVAAAGARGYVLKSDRTSQLVAAVRALAEHRPYFTTAPTEAILNGYAQPGFNGEIQSGALTPREREVVQLVTEGKSNKEVAEALRLSVKTVETHRSSIMRKLGISSVVDLVRYAIRNKIVEP